MRHKRNKGMVIAIGIFLTIVAIYIKFQGSNICINEVCTKNLTVYTCDDGMYPDGYVELYNKGDKEVDISGWYISNQGRKFPEQQKNNIEKVSIKPHDYLVLPINEDKKGIQSEVILENICESITFSLYNAEGILMDNIKLPVLSVDISYGRDRDGASGLNALKGTPGSSNNGAEQVQVPELDDPVFSAESGFYENAFSLELSAEKGNDIYYTLDGSVPSNKSIHYDNPIVIEDVSKKENKLSNRRDMSALEYPLPETPVDKGTIIRAVAYNKQGKRSEVVTKTYFVGKRMQQNYGNELGVVSIVADPEDLVGYENGIMVLGEKYDIFLTQLGKTPTDKQDYHIEANFSQRGRIAERNVEFFYFEEGNLELQQSVGIRIRGQSSSVGPQKGFGIFPREMYDGKKNLEYDIFKNSCYASKAVLKNSNSILRDGFFNDLLQDRSMPKLYYCPVSLFINGEYWGLYMLSEKYDTSYFQNHYGVDKDSVVIYKNGKIEYSNEKDKGRYKEEIQDIIETAANTDLSIQANYDELCQRIDIESFIEYYCTLIYMDAEDNAETYNVLMWKAVSTNEGTPYADNKWRWCLYDLDTSLIDYTRDNMSQEIREDRPAYFEHYLLNGLLNNDKFRIQFINTFMDMMNFNFAVDDTVPLYVEKATKLCKAVELQGIRFPDKKKSWFAEVEKDIHFLKNRKEYVIKYLQEYFGLGTLANVEVEADKGIREIKVNTATIALQEKKVTMQYFPGLPIRLTGVVNEGYQFEGWIISQDGKESIKCDETVEIVPGSDIKIKIISHDY